MPGAALAVDRRARRAKSDGIDAELLLRTLLAWLRGEPRVCSMVPIPTEADEKKTTPQDVFDATTAALKSGADGVIFSRKYSEMRLANLAAGGRAVKELAG